LSGESCSWEKPSALAEGVITKHITLRQDGSYLEVRASNESAIALYQKYGFKIAQTKPNYYRSPQEDAYLMRFDYAAYLAQRAQRKAA